jgi:HEAT repeat protein
MRPAGEVRSVIADALRQVGPMTLRDIAERSQVGYDACRRTLDNMVRALAVHIVGYEKREHCDKWVALYDLVPDPETCSDATSGAVLLESAMALWSR